MDFLSAFGNGVVMKFYANLYFVQPVVLVVVAIINFPLNFWKKGYWIVTFNMFRGILGAMFHPKKFKAAIVRQGQLPHIMEHLKMDVRKILVEKTAKVSEQLSKIQERLMFSPEMVSLHSEFIQLSVRKQELEFLAKRLDTNPSPELFLMIKAKLESF